MSIAFQKVPWRDDVVCIAKPMRIWDRLFLFDKPIECFAFLFPFFCYVYF